MSALSSLTSFDRVISDSYQSESPPAYSTQKSLPRLAHEDWIVSGGRQHWSRRQRQVTELDGLRQEESHLNYAEARFVVVLADDVLRSFVDAFVIIATFSLLGPKFTVVSNPVHA